MKILSLCTSAGLWDKVLVERGHTVTAGCEIEAHKRAMYRAYVGGEHLAEDIHELPDILKGCHFDAIVGGPPCQSHSNLRAIRDPKFPDLTQAVQEVLNSCTWGMFVFENVRAIELASPSCAYRMNAMHWPEQRGCYHFRFGESYLHQSRSRWFTVSEGLEAPAREVEGTVDDLMAYPVVAGRIYGPKRGALLQGHPEFAQLDFPCKQLQEALADGVPRGLATAWAHRMEEYHR